MRWLILSDIHGNLPALESVLADAKGRCDALLCLGDIVGYGADPNAVTERIRETVPTVIRGNHDRACTGDPTIETFTDLAYSAAMWTRQVLTEENAGYLRSLPAGPIALDGFHIAHGSPRDEDEYVFTRQDAADQFSCLPSHVCFFGHTHVQGGFGLRRGRTWGLAKPDDAEQEAAHTLEPDTCYLVNPGSVGQPRDSDPRASYAIFDGEARTVHFRRVRYDIEAARKKILAAGLHPFLAARLVAGR